MKSEYQKFLDKSRARRERAKRMRDDGLTLSAIAKKLGITRQRVHQILT